jgi:hypothetical protein
VIIDPFSQKFSFFFFTIEEHCKAEGVIEACSWMKVEVEHNILDVGAVAVEVSDHYSY